MVVDRGAETVICWRHAGGGDAAVLTPVTAAEDDALREKPDENSGVEWFTPEEALAASTEPWMVQRVYRKLADRAAAYMKT